MAPHIINFGLVLLPDYQWLDAAGPVDYIHAHSQQMVRHAGVDQATLEKVPIINWHYISSDLTPVRASSGPLQIPTCTYDDCPPLDYIVVPGPDPVAPPPAAFGSFLKKRLEDPQMKAIILICTAALAVANTGLGLLDGKQVCTNKFTLRALATRGLLNPKVKWVGDKRWVVDGKIWSSAGITAGIDIAAAFAKQHFDEEIVKLVKDVSEFEEKPAQPDAFARLLEGVKLP